MNSLSLSNSFGMLVVVVLLVSSWSVYGFTTSISHRHSLIVVLQESQAEYGQSLEMPTTYATCGQCGSSYALKEDDLGETKGRCVPRDIKMRERTYFFVVESACNFFG
jgi:hypothetical protein